MKTRLQANKQTSVAILAQASSARGNSEPQSGVLRVTKVSRTSTMAEADPAKEKADKPKRVLVATFAILLEEY